MDSNVNNFRPSPIPKGVEGDIRRIELAVKRCRKVLSSNLAQDSRCIKMGMELTVSIVPTEDPEKFNIIFPSNLNLPDLDAIHVAMMQFRPFVLKQENVYWERVLDSLRRATRDKKLRKDIDLLQYFLRLFHLKDFNLCRQILRPVKIYYLQGLQMQSSVLGTYILKWHMQTTMRNC